MLSKEVKSYLPKIKNYLKDQPVLKAWLFGSCSRGEETTDSDLDLLVDYDHENFEISLFTILSISFGLEDLLGRKIDLVENGCLKDFAVHSANQDKILIYER